LARPLHNEGLLVFKSAKISVMIKLVAMDIDNTLTSPDGAIDTSVIGAIQKLYFNGIHIALVSARSLQGIDSIANLLGIKAHQIANLGAIIRTATVHELQRLTINIDIARDIAKIGDLQRCPAERL
jgi:HAD superfamily hydrolase (TIGR01484 family)